MNVEKQYKKSSSNIVQSKKNSELGFVDNRVGTIAQNKLISSIINSGDISFIQQKSLLDFSNIGIIQRQKPDFTDKEITWRKTGGGIEKHCEWEMTRLAILERPEEIVAFGSNKNSYGQQIYILTWPKILHEKYGNPHPKCWKDGHILFAYDATAKIAYVYHSGPGG